MQWRDRASQAARQTRLAMTWGVQMVLYPIYVLFQSGRLVGYQLRQAVTRLRPLLEAVKDDDFDPQLGAPPVTSDRLFYNTLDYLETFELPIILSPQALPQADFSALSAASTKIASDLASEVASCGGWIYPAVPFRLRSAIPTLSAVRQPNAAGAIALNSEWRLVASPSAADELVLTGHFSLASDAEAVSIAPDLAVMGFTELAPAAAPSHWRGMALRQAIAQLRQPVVPVQDSQPGTVNVTQMVRGVACLLKTQTLVLVNSYNQVLDILSPQQQFQLHQRIVLEAATYHRRYRLQVEAQQAAHRAHTLARRWGRFLPPPHSKSTTLPPVRAFQSLMGWIQTSPVAIATNVFQESVLVSVPDRPQITQTLALTKRPTALSNMPLRSPVSLPSKPRRSFWHDLLHSIRQSGQAKSNVAPLRASAPSTTLQSWFDPDRQGSDDGWFSANQLSLARRRAEAFPPVPSLPHRSRWMPDWANSFFNPGDSLDVDLAEDVAESLSEGEAIAPRFSSQSGGALNFPDPNDNLNPVWSSASNAEIASGEGAIASSTSQSIPSLNRRRGDADLAPAEEHDDFDQLASTIIETRATLVGYVKHPLEQLLEWIDLGMVWIERWVERIWSWLRSSS